MLKKCKWIVFALILILLGSVSAQAANTLTLPAGTTEIHAQAFYGDTAIGEVKLPEGLLRIESQAFAASSVTKINLPSSLTFIAEDAFENCNRLEHVTVQAGTYAYTRAHEIGLFDLRALISGSVKEAVAGESIVWTAKAMNGVAPYKYLFEVYRDGEKIDSRAYTAEDSYTYQFTRAGEYYAIAKIKDDDGNVASAKSAIVTVTANAPVIESVSCNCEVIKTDERVTWVVTAKKGSIPYTYTYVLLANNEVIYQKMDNSNTFSYIFENEGDYVLAVTVTDAYKECTTLEIAFSVSLKPVRIRNISCSHETIKTDDKVVWTVSAEAGKQPYTYSFELFKQNISICASENRTENYFTFAFGEPGEYMLSVTVTDAAGNRTVMNTEGFSVSTSELSLNKVISKEEIELGETATWVVEASGGVKPLTYAFDLFKDGEEIDGAAFSEKNAFSYTPDAVGVYFVRVRVRDALRTTIETDSKEVRVYQATSGENFSYTISDNMAIITGYTGTDSTVYLPALLNGYPVTSIAANAFENSTAIINITIPDSIERIGSKAFSSCTNLKNLRLPNVGVSIDAYAFDGCSSLENVYIDSLEGWLSIEFNGYNSNPMCCGENLYIDGKKPTEVTIPENMTHIGNYAFWGCNSLTKVNASINLLTIGEYAFYKCVNLANVVFPNGLLSIERCAFGNCSNLENVTFPDSLTKIGGSAFQDCGKITIAEIPASVTTVGISIFKNCSALRKVTIPGCMISGGTFGYSGTFTGFFGEDTKVEEVIIHDGATIIGNAAFKRCRSIIKISIPASVTTISEEAFYSCSSLVEVQIPDGVTSVGNYAFFGCSAKRYANRYSDGAYALSLRFYDFVDPEYPELYLRAYKDEKQKRVFSVTDCDNVLTSVDFPDDVTKIEEEAFMNCTTLIRMDVPVGITYIGPDAFRNCTNLKEINLPYTLTNIGASAFWECSSLSSIVIPDGIRGLWYFMFYRCTSLRSITIPRSVETFDGPFIGCSEELVVYCYSSSAAHEYCKNQGIKFKLLSD